VVAERLRALGLEVRTGIGGHGVVGILRGGQPGPVVAFRADMDAVPSDAPDPVEFRSLRPGVRHICGHDVHTTIGLALAEGLAAVRAELPGTVVLLFQPAEENASGARAMLAAGVLDDPRPRAIYAFHTAPFTAGQVATTPGVMMAWRDLIKVKLTGSGDLSAAAERVRAILQGVATLSESQALAPSQDKEFLAVGVSPARPAEGGGLALQGMVSTASTAASERAQAKVAAELAGLGLLDVQVEHQYQARAIAGVENDPQLVERARAAAGSIVGTENVIPLEVVVPAFSEDFGSFQAEVPGVMFFLGVSNPEKGWVGMPHSPGYVADEEAIFVGARVMAAVLFDALAAAPE
jgi:metal-dependent amidase/aminoacylase/carboxypeptidase family protein